MTREEFPFGADSSAARRSDTNESVHVPRLARSTAPHWFSLVAAAVQAPSSHNTQPWLFVVNDDTVDVVEDRRRALPVNDPDDRELTISCGCALLNLRAAVAHAGFGAHVQIWPEGRGSAVAARLTVVRGSLPRGNHAALFPAIGGRQTYRKAFADHVVPAAVRLELERAALMDGARLFVLDDRERADVAALVAEGNRLQWANAEWRRELAAWMHAREAGDGLTVPAWLRVVAQLAVRRFDFGNRVARSDEALMQRAPLVAILATATDDRAAWLGAGQALERVLLTARLRGLQASFMNQPIQVAALRSRLREMVPGMTMPQLILRLGYPAAPIAAAPRRPVRDVLRIEGGAPVASRPAS